MNATIKFLIGCFLAIPLSANALIITDIISVDRNASPGVTLDFDLKRGGYNPVTDSITFVKMTYSLREIVEFDDYEDESTLESGVEYSMIFDRRSFFRDVSTGTFSQQMSWFKTDACQIGGYDDEPCTYSLDLFGTTAQSFAFYTDNIWFEEGRLEVEVDRISVPEPATILLLCVGLLGFGARSFRKLGHAHS